MYQWVEERHERRINDREVEIYYTYSLQWRNGKIESGSFNDKQFVNSDSFPVESKILKGKIVKIGEYHLTEN
jgi:hypothetical protein